MAAVAVAVGAILLAAGSVVMGLQETRLTCSSVACTIVKTYPSARTEHALANIRAVEIHEGSGKARGSWRVSLIDTRGASIRLHSAKQTEAEALQRELEELLAGKREAVERVTPPSYWMLAFAVPLLAFAFYEIRSAIRSRGRYARTVKPTTSATSKQRPMLLWSAGVGVAILVSGLANLALDAGTADSTGVLELECRHRCEFSGGTCMPGGAMELPLKPGEYTVKVWNPKVAGNWEPRTVQVELGKRTRFVCEPGG